MSFKRGSVFCLDLKSGVISWNLGGVEAQRERERKTETEREGTERRACTFPAELPGEGVRSYRSFLIPSSRQLPGILLVASLT